jgi:hypothetical protein
MDKVRADYISYSMYECGTNIALYNQNIEKLKRSLNGRSFYIGELNKPEREFPGSDAHALSMRTMIDVTLRSGAEFCILWEIYDNEPSGSDSIAEDKGFGLIRRDGSATALYTSLQKTLTGKTSGVTASDFPKDSLITTEYFTNLGKIVKWLELHDGVARGAVIKLKNDFRPEKGWVMHTSRVTGGNKGDSFARKGENVSLWLPDAAPGVVIK